MENTASVNTAVEDQARLQETIDMVRERFPEVTFPEPVLEPLYFGRLNKTTVDNRKLVMDKNTGAQLDIVSDAYTLVHHESMVRNLIDGCPEEFGKPELSIDILKNGAVCSVKAKFPEMGDFKVSGQKIDPEIRLVNSYDRSKNLGYNMGARVLVCSNGLTAFKSQESGKFKHIDCGIGRAQIQARVKDDLGVFSDQVGVWTKWAEHAIGTTLNQELLETFDFSDTERERIIDMGLLTRGGATMRALGKELTVWDIASAATQFARHHVNSELRVITLEHDISKAVTLFMTKHKIGE